MPRRSSELAEAHQTCRDLRNQISNLEFPLQKRIRELEVERDSLAARVASQAREIRRLERGMMYARRLLRWILASGKNR